MQDNVQDGVPACMHDSLRALSAPGLQQASLA